MENEDLTFPTEEAAKAALSRANEAWPKDEEFQPEGQILRVRCEDGMMEPDPEGAFWAVLEAKHGEYAVCNDAGEGNEIWVCVV